MKFLIPILIASLSFSTFAQTSAERNWIDTSSTFSDSSGNEGLITNSLPKGGGTYTDAEGTTYSYVIFWHRVVNTAKVPLAFEIRFPAKPLPIFDAPESHIRIVLPSEEMSAENIGMHDYGLSNLKALLDTDLNTSGKLARTFRPGEEYIFNVVILLYQAQGTARADLIINNNKAFYRLKVNPDTALLPCGEVTFTN